MTAEVDRFDGAGAPDGAGGSTPVSPSASSAASARPNLAFVTDRLATGGDLHHDPQIALSDLEAIVELGITHIVDVRIEWSDEEFVAEHAPHITYVHLGMDDAGQRVPDTWFDHAVGVVLDSLDEPDTKVLTHCHMGINRGPSLAYASLLHLGHDVVDALDLVRSARPIAAIGYARDALRHFHTRLDVDFADRERNWTRLESWFSDNHIDVSRIIRGLRAEEGTIVRDL